MTCYFDHSGDTHRTHRGAAHAGPLALAGLLALAGSAPAAAPRDPPLPAPGQAVMWGPGPIEICASATIPAGGVVEMAPDTELFVRSGVTLAVAGELRAHGTAAEPVALGGPGSAIVTGLISAEHARVTLDIDRGSGGVVRVASAVLADGDVLGSSSRDSLVILEDVVVQSGWPTSLGQLALRNVEFLDPGPFAQLSSYCFAQDVTVLGTGLTVLADHQPRLLSNVDIINPGPVPALELSGGGIWPGTNVLIDDQCDLVGASVPVRVLVGGLHPESVLPASGSTMNAIEIGGAGAGSGVCDLPDVGLPYHLADDANIQGRARVGAGATFLCEDFAGLLLYGSFFDDTALLRGTPEAPVRVLPARPGVQHAGVALFNATAEHLEVRGASISSVSGFNQILECTVRDAPVGIFGDASGSGVVRGCQLYDNQVGAEDDPTFLMCLDMAGHERPNIFEGNVVAAENNANPSGSTGPFPAQRNWWGHASGPQSPWINPDGQGDPIGFGVQAESWRTVRPDLSDTPPVVELQWPFILAEPGDTLLLRWDARDDGEIVEQRILMDTTGGGIVEYTVMKDGLAPTRRSAFLTIPDIGQTADARSTILRIEATDDAGYRGHHDVTLQTPVHHRPVGTGRITTDLTGGFLPREQRQICYELDQWPPGAAATNIWLVLDTEANRILKGPTGRGGCTISDIRFPIVSTNRARFLLYADGVGNDNAWHFSEPFEIRPLDAFPDRPPEVTMTSPVAGERFAGGRVLPIRWEASDDESLREFRIQVSLNDGRTWSTYDTVAGERRGYDLSLPPLDRTLHAVRVRVVAVDHRFQATAHGDDRVIAFDPGELCRVDLDADGELTIFDFLAFQNAFAAGESLADFDGDGELTIFDFLAFQNEFAAGCA